MASHAHNKEHCIIDRNLEHIGSGHGVGGNSEYALAKHEFASDHSSSILTETRSDEAITRVLHRLMSCYGLSTVTHSTNQRGIYTALSPVELKSTPYRMSASASKESMQFAIKENVLCFHGPLIYEAQVSLSQSACL